MRIFRHVLTVLMELIVLGALLFIPSLNGDDPISNHKYAISAVLIFVLLVLAFVHHRSFDRKSIKREAEIPPWADN